ncbi:hypothetical protein [Kribbella albertanoniae]|uniref:Uncharacterized protein n=1 Tax=Kribbella albertanoniae TaxID=1266829 RepID=A0A4R4QEK3_9ACTN|nr:hypothetical protein [Kribbella albertanoniae]TDC33649.1 hypothetical protein E1261_05465 [Kribbella albertanoniae]
MESSLPPDELQTVTLWSLMRSNCATPDAIVNVLSMGVQLSPGSSSRLDVSALVSNVRVQDGIGSLTAR